MTEAETMVFVIDDEAAMREALQSLIRFSSESTDTIFPWSRMRRAN